MSIQGTQGQVQQGSLDFIADCVDPKNQDFCLRGCELLKLPVLVPVKELEET